MVTRWRSVSTSDRQWCAGAITTPIGLLPAVIAHTHLLRRRGLLGLEAFESILVLPNTRWIHTLGMQFPIDVAHVDVSGAIITSQTVSPNKLTLPVLSAQMVLESYAGMMSQHGLAIGMKITVSHVRSVAI